VEREGIAQLGKEQAECGFLRTLRKWNRRKFDVAISSIPPFAIAIAATIAERIAYHEAEHVIAGVVFGIPITRATIVHDPQVQCGRYHTDAGRF
jgi:hypothetical protein